ncbi:MAG: N-acetylmuramoyl-L-alanine amidase [Methylocystis sp.]|nr:N-acetylmuramoyl-L-alanine amidase [Methylocystis sp.]
MLFHPDFPQARPHPSPNHGERRRAISSLVLHYTGTPTGAAALELLCSEGTDVSAHYFVQEDGEILQLAPEARRAWHAGRGAWAGEEDMNSASIGIEIVHPGHDDPRPFPPQQIRAVATLCHDICARRGIRPERVLAHSDIAPGRKIDPGEFFPWRELAKQGVGLFIEPVPVAPGPVLAIGATGSEVEELQTMLADYGYKIAVSGRYDQDTANVVEAFQRHFRPERVDGRADVSTIATLRDLRAALRAHR